MYDAAMTDNIRMAIRVELAKKDMNRADLARLTGTTRQHVSNLMTGKAGNLLDVWQRILDVLDLELTVTPKER